VPGTPLNTQFVLLCVVLTVAGMAALIHTVGGKLTARLGLTTEIGTDAVREHWLLSVTVSDTVCCPVPKVTGPGVAKPDEEGDPLLKVQLNEVKGPGMGEPLVDKLPVILVTKGGLQPEYPSEEKIWTLGGLEACTVPPEEAMAVQPVTASITVSTGT